MASNQFVLVSIVYCQMWELECTYIRIRKDRVTPSPSPLHSDFGLSLWTWTWIVRIIYLLPVCDCRQRHDLAHTSLSCCSQDQTHLKQ